MSQHFLKSEIHSRFRFLRSKINIIHYDYSFNSYVQDGLRGTTEMLGVAYVSTCFTDIHCR